MKHDCGPLLKAINAYIQKADDELTDALEAAGFIEPAETVAEAADLEELLAQALKRQTRHITNSAEEAVDLETFARDVWPDVKLTDDLDEKVRQIFVEEFVTYMPELASHYSKKIDPELTVSQLTKRTTAWVESWSEELGSLMKLNSHNEIETILKTGLQEGHGMQQFIQDILDSGIRDEYYKARRAALTEVLRAHSYAALEAMTQNPAATHKEWVHTGSQLHEPRENHVKLSGTVVPYDEPFELEGADGSTYWPMCPRDTELPAEEAINCHCITRAVPDETILGLPIEERRRLQEEAIAEDDGEWEKELDAINRAKAGIEIPS